MESPLSVHFFSLLVHYTFFFFQITPIYLQLFYLVLIKVGDLKKGLNPSSIHYLNFDSRYLPATLRAGIVTGLISLVVSILQFLSFFG